MPAKTVLITISYFFAYHTLAIAIKHHPHDYFPAISTLFSLLLLADCLCTRIDRSFMRTLKQSLTHSAMHTLTTFMLAFIDHLILFLFVRMVYCQSYMLFALFTLVLAVTAGLHGECAYAFLLVELLVCTMMYEMDTYVTFGRAPVDGIFERVVVGEGDTNYAVLASVMVLFRIFFARLVGHTGHTDRTGHNDRNADSVSNGNRNGRTNRIGNADRTDRTDRNADSVSNADRTGHNANTTNDNDSMTITASMAGVAVPLYPFFFAILTTFSLPYLTIPPLISSSLILLSTTILFILSTLTVHAHAGTARAYTAVLCTYVHILLFAMDEKEYVFVRMVGERHAPLPRMVVLVVLPLVLGMPFCYECVVALM